MMNNDGRCLSPTRRRRVTKTSIDNGVAVIEESVDRPQRRRRRRKSPNDPPFWVLVLQVGATLFGVCVMVVALRWAIPPSDEVGDDYADDQPNEEDENEDGKVVPTRPALLQWSLGEASRYDAFGIAEIHSIEGDEFWDTATSMRQAFADRYGGENAARAILERGLSTFSNIEHTACRILDAKNEGRPFKFSFGGYSVTVGRGNFFSQSFPFVMERILKRPFQILGVELQVRNAAIGGVPSFPYGFCLENFWGSDADVVSWDYSMNEAGGIPQGLEAYIRHTLMLNGAPKLIVKDTHMAEARRSVLKTYAKNGVLLDSVVVHTDPAATPFLELSEEARPVGFKEWRLFGSPPGAPGQALHHPAVKEHEFIAWLLAMHFLGPLELVAADQSSHLLQCPSRKKAPLPPPVSVNPVNNTMDWFSILFGVPVNKTRNWTLNPIRCRTSFEPTLGGKLDSLVLSGTVGNDTDIMMPKGAMFYSKGWVLDLSDEEKLAKRKLDRYNGLGYIDSKKAYYGIYASGPLRLFLPYEGDGSPKLDDAATDWFRSVLFCEVNEKRDYGSCNAENHVSYGIGGVNATHVRMIDSPGTLYYGKKLCLYARVPIGAKLTSRRQLLNDTNLDGSLGLSVDIQVKNMHIMKKNLACSLSHVVWEETAPSTTA